MDVHHRPVLTSGHNCNHAVHSLHQKAHLCKLIEQAQMRQYIDSYFNDTLLQIYIWSVANDEKVHAWLAASFLLGSNFSANPLPLMLQLAEIPTSFFIQHFIGSKAHSFDASTSQVACAHRVRGPALNTLRMRIPSIKSSAGTRFHY